MPRTLDRTMSNLPQRARAGPARSSPRAPTVLTARGILTGGGELLEGGGLLIQGGEIGALLRSPAAVSRACTASGVRAIDLGDVVLAPGLVDAHSHLELTGLRGRLPRDGTFTDWIRALLSARAARGSEHLAEDVRAGADRLLATGTTTSGDIASSAAVLSALRGHPLRLRLYREVLDAGQAARTAAALAALDWEMPRRARTWKGISPHAPYSVSESLFRELGRRARAGRVPLGIHWAETAEEVAWLELGRGPMSALLEHSPRQRGLDLIAGSGLLGRRTALIHGNQASAAERERVAASGAALVHCPGTHAFFGRERFDLESWSKLGVVVALGTDSLASNEDLDMRREMRLLRRAHPELAPARVWDMATRAGARALGFAGRAGEIVPGAWADFSLHATSARTAGAVLEHLTAAETQVAGVWIAGRAVRPRGIGPAHRA
jgi:cytosine/adenosine deaminase-related metal-dependent hydrolase